jgi:hypothetical protein
VYALDQLTKLLALHYLEPGDPVDVIGSFLRFRLIRNSGAAFSLGADYTPIISAVQIAVAAGVVWLSRRLGSYGWAVAFGLLLGGAVGTSPTGSSVNRRRSADTWSTSCNCRTGRSSTWPTWPCRGRRAAGAADAARRPPGRLP